MTRGSTHVMAIVDAACDERTAQQVGALACALRDLDVRVSALCHDAPGIARGLRTAGCSNVTEAPLGDYPCWRTVQVATAWIAQEQVDVLHAHGGGAHALGALVGAITERPVLASIRGEEIPMLDLEAHRLGPWSHLALADDRAWRQATTLGIPRTRMTHLPDDVRATADLLLRLAAGVVVDGAGVVRALPRVTAPDGARLR